jgi:16S rRNA (guanine527-N7)-methyltransferase
MRRGKKPKDNRANSIISLSKHTLPDDAVISSALAPFGLALAPALAAAIRQYMELLLRWNQKISLTSITGPREILQRHFAESMFASSAIPIVRGHLVDIGSGAGFPGLALKLIAPELEVALIETNMKKSAFLAEVVRTLGLNGVKIISKRIEELSGLEGTADFVTCRAVRPDKRLLAWTWRALAAYGKCVLWVGSEDAAALQEESQWSWQSPIAVPLSTRRVLLVGSPIRIDLILD